MLASRNTIAGFAATCIARNAPTERVRQWNSNAPTQAVAFAVSMLRVCENCYAAVEAARDAEANKGSTLTAEEADKLHFAREKLHVNLGLVAHAGRATFMPTVSVLSLAKKLPKNAKTRTLTRVSSRDRRRLSFRSFLQTRRLSVAVFGCS
jgi:hypothetical protein